MELQDGQLSEELANGGCYITDEHSPRSFHVRRRTGKLTKSENGECETHGVILESGKEKYAICKNTPDEDIPHNPCSKSIAINQSSANPIKRHKIPCQRPRKRANVNQSRSSAVAEIRDAKIEEIDDDEQFGEPKVVPYPKVDEAEEEEIGGDVVSADVGCCGYVDCVCGVERPGVDQLEHEENDPKPKSAPSPSDLGCVDCSPVYRCHHAILGKRRCRIVSPNRVLRAMALMRSLKGIVYGCGEKDDVGDEGGDAEEDELLGGVLFAVGEGVDYIIYQY